ncbi:MAG: Inner membrane protein YjcH [Gemmatimonadaceae bacterium]|nr:Inner membrane protein YjcH [Gemmatimonadaceae bacterium]
MSDHDSDLQALSRERMRYAVALTLAMIAVYFGFILLLAYDKPLMGKLLMPGLSLGILLGALVIVVSWLLTYAYVRWANRVYDARLDALKR